MLFVWMPNHSQSAYVHLVPIEPGESLPSWLLRIAARNAPNFRRFSSVWFSDELRVTPGFDAFPAASLLMKLGAIRPEELDHYISHHTLLGTIKPFYTEDEWSAMIDTHGTKGSRIYTLRRKTKQQSWHICPACRALELERGVATWQVFPQIPGLHLCHEHGILLVLSTSTRIPPLAAPAETDLSFRHGELAGSAIGHEEDHTTLARDVAEVITAGPSCRSPSQSFRDSIALLLWGARWPSKGPIWPMLVARFGEPFLDAVQVRSYHQKQIRLGRLHPSFHGLVYLALVARAFGSTLRGLFAATQ